MNIIKTTSQEKKRIPLIVILAAIFVLLFTSLFSFFIFDHIPHIHDEIGYLFQAKIFKIARLYVASPPEREFFDFPHIINNGKWYSQYTPGFPLLLLLGLIFGIPWLINPILAALSIFLFYLLGKELYDRNTGILASILGALSIWFLLMSSTMLSHTSCLFFLTLFLLFLFRSLKHPNVLNGLLLGIGWGAAFLIRPYTTFLVSLPFLLYFAVKIFPLSKQKTKNAAAALLVALMFLCLLFAYNQITNGHALRMGYITRYGETHGIGFNKTGFTDIPHTPMLGFSNTLDNLKDMNDHLFGWPLSSFLAILPLLWFKRIRQDFRKKDVLLASGIFCLIIGNFFYWASLILLGARLYFETIPLLLLLSARGINEIPNLLKLKEKPKQPSLIKRAGLVLLIIFTIFAFFVRFKQWIHPPGNEWYYYRISQNFQGTTSGIHRSISSLGLQNAVVFMRFLYHPVEYFPGYWWRSGFFYNDPLLDGEIVFARDLRDKNIQLFPHYPNRKFYLFTGTIKKGILVPLNLDNSLEKFISREPLIPEQIDKNSIELIKDPQQFFTLYSQGFKDFIKEMTGKDRIYVPDVLQLYEKGIEFMDLKEYEKAAFSFEAALQIENNPFIRFRLLGKLAVCYNRIGNSLEARRISTLIESFQPNKLYNIFPEKGF